MYKTSNNKETIEKVKNHIARFFDNGLTDFKNEVKNLMKHDKSTSYQAILKLVDGGCFLFYYEDIREFLKDILKNLYNDKFSDEKAWNFYKNKLAIVGSRLIK